MDLKQHLKKRIFVQSQMRLIIKIQKETKILMNTQTRLQVLKIKLKKSARQKSQTFVNVLE